MLVKSSSYLWVNLETTHSREVGILGIRSIGIRIVVMVVSDMVRAGKWVRVGWAHGLTAVPAPTSVVRRLMGEIFSAVENVAQTSVICSHSEMRESIIIARIWSRGCSERTLILLAGWADILSASQGSTSSA
jgi:hypothetical protein